MNRRRIHGGGKKNLDCTVEKKRNHMCHSHCMLDSASFLWTIPGPDSSYSSFLTHMSSKVEREARMDPPIQTEYFLSGGATILTVMEEGAFATISLLILSAIPGNIVDPPDMTTFPYKSFRISMSHFMIEL